MQAIPSTEVGELRDCHADLAEIGLPRRPGVDVNVSAGWGKIGRRLLMGGLDG
jgi:hypothetical protein